jgi:hypothetical protein
MNLPMIHQVLRSAPGYKLINMDLGLDIKMMIDHQRCPKSDQWTIWWDLTTKKNQERESNWKLKSKIINPELQIFGFASKSGVWIKAERYRGNTKISTRVWRNISFIFHHLLCNFHLSVSFLFSFWNDFIQSTCSDVPQHFKFHIQDLSIFFNIVTIFIISQSQSRFLMNINIKSYFFIFEWISHIWHWTNRTTWTFPHRSFKRSNISTSELETEAEQTRNAPLQPKSLATNSAKEIGCFRMSWDPNLQKYSHFKQSNNGTQNR